MYQNYWEFSSFAQLSEEKAPGEGMDDGDDAHSADPNLWLLKSLVEPIRI